MIYDDRVAELGEGAFWHPSRREFFWFDILNGKLMSQDVSGPHEWELPEMVSAAAYVAYYVILIAGEQNIFLYGLDTREIMPICKLDKGNFDNRSNDGKTDRQGGFWIGTMGKDPANRKGKGAIYRLYKGSVRKIYPDISIPNAICFSPDGTIAYFADTMEQTVWKVALDADGWPAGEREVYLDFKGTEIYPDGATIDAAGNFWNAQWGAGRVACYSAAGEYLREVKVDAPHTSCPSFGGENMDTLFVTTALEEMTPQARAAYPNAGKVFAFEGIAKGLEEPKFQP